MQSLAHLTIHRSQFPEAVREDLRASLRSRQIRHKFHYDGVKQTQKWLELHEAYSPARTDPSCAAVYDEACQAAADMFRGRKVQVVGLGCGGGRKDIRLLESLKLEGAEPKYLATDVSAAMVLVARTRALPVISEAHFGALVCDLEDAPDLPEVLDTLTDPDLPRLFTFFGMMPNFEPARIVPLLARLQRPGDICLVSANLAPGPDYAEGVRRILPLYDNPLTKEWLMMLPIDLGIEKGQAHAAFSVEDAGPDGSLKRITADLVFDQGARICLDSERFDFKPGEKIRLFFSYRHTPRLLAGTFLPHGLCVGKEWITHAGDEGVFLVRESGMGGLP